MVVDELVFAREFERVARWAGDRTALTDLGTGLRRTFAEHRAAVARLGGALRDRLDLAPGDRFSALLDNRAVYAELWHAGLSGAGVFTSLNSRIDRDELRHTLRDAGSSVLFTSAPFAAMVDEVRADLPELRTVVLVGEGDVPHDLRHDDLVRGADERMPEPPREDDPAMLLYTGGTTGLPRGVVLDQRAVMLNRHRSVEVMAPTRDWTFLQVVPMYHVAALMPLVKVHLAGAGVVVAPRWDPGAALEVIERERIGALSIVPTMAVQLLEHPDFAPERLASLRFLGYGTAPMPLGLLRRLIDVLPARCRITQSYGMTESCGTVTMLDDDDHRGGDPSLLRSAGRALSGVELSVRDGAGEPVPTGDTGEIWVRCGSVLREYRGQPEATAAVLEGGWYHSGDVGRLDARGYLWVVDRVKDMIVSGGENVYSVEVENAISTLPGVARVAVFGVPHELWGEAVHAVVQVSVGSALTEDDVLAHASERLARYKLPRSVEMRRDELPVSAAGKVLKRQLRAERADNAELLGSLPDLGVEMPAIVRGLEADRGERGN